MAARSVIAIVPMRHDSQRVPGKNYRPFAGRPLYHHVVQSLLDCPGVAQVVIDTDSPIILGDCARAFPQVKLLNRPEHLRSDRLPMNDVLMNTVNELDGELFLQTHSTNPLVRSQTFQDAIDRFFDEYPAYDSLFSVSRLQVRLWDQLSRPVNHNPAILLRTQDLPPVYAENSCFYLFHKSTLKDRRNRIGERPLMFELSGREAMDIDEEDDFRLAELAYMLHGAPALPASTAAREVAA